MNISSVIIPLMIFTILFAGLYKGVSVYDLFIDGANDAIHTLVKIIAPMCALMCAVNMLRASGAIELLSNLLAPLANKLGFPIDVLPFALMRPVSGSASLAILKDIFQNFGPDSLQGNVASVISGSSETTFYTMSVYFAATHIKNTRHTLKAALIADICGVIFGTMAVYIFNL